jgi:methyltransferase (TIGR00027 family)
MENNKASMTALVSAFGRAYHALYDQPKIFNDDLARRLISDEEFAQISASMAAGIQFFNPGAEINDPELALRWVVHHQLAPTPLARASYCEKMVSNAFMTGTRQYVILGAGFDTFAYRSRDVLKRMSIYEVDHPATQALKLSRIKQMGWEKLEGLYYVPVDFRVDNFAEKMLEEYTFDPNARSIFSWLGVTYYLSKAQILKTLKDIVSIAPRGSSIIFDYADQDLFDPERTSPRVQKMVAMAAATGEPMLSGFSYRELEKLLEEVGLLIYEHLAPAEIEKEFFAARSDDYHAFENTHFVLAVVH